MERISVVQGDITKQVVDAIVNAANEGLLGGGGVDGAIHRAAGPELLNACRALPEVTPGVRCPTGEARLTPGFRLRCRVLVHTVGPVWNGGHCREAELLASCYRNAFNLAASAGARSIAFPAISCGIFAFPIAAAARIAVTELAALLANHAGFEAVHLVAFEREVAEALGSAIADPSNQRRS